MSTDIALLLKRGGRVARPLEGAAHAPSQARPRHGQPQAQAFASLLSTPRAEAVRRGHADEVGGKPPSDEKGPRDTATGKGRDTERHLSHGAHAVVTEPRLQERPERSVRDEAPEPTGSGEAATPTAIALPDIAPRMPMEVPEQAIMRSGPSGPALPSADTRASPVLVADQPQVASEHTRPDGPRSPAGDGRPASEAMPLSPEAITARIVVERIEVHHSPVSGFERLQAMSALAQAPLRPDRPPATSDRPAATGDDTADAVLTSERRADAATGWERVAGSDHGAHAERWRPDRRGDMFGGSGGRRGWDSFSPGPSAAAVSAVAGPEPVRQEFATARDAAPVAGTLVAPIAGSLLAAVEDMQAAEVASAGPAAGPHQAAPGGTPVKALELTLLPDQLGPIAVRMRLENGALSVTMKAHSHGDTAALVVERDAIEDTLRKSGYAIDAVTVSIAPEPAARPTDSQLSQQTAHHGGADIGGGRSEATGAGGRDRDGHRPPSTDVPAGRPGSDDASQGPEQNPRRGPGLYV